MFIFKKFMTPFLLPPGIFIALLLFAGVWFLFKKRWTAGFANFTIVGLMWFFSIAPVSDALLRGLEYDFKIPENPKGDVIILLGGGVYDEAPDLTGTGAPSEEMMGRLVTAVRLQRRLNVPVIISSGSVYEGRKAEAPIGRRFLVDLGVPAEKVIVEDKSRDTFENAKYTAEICKKHDYKKPILVTSASHMKRSIMSFEKAGIKVLPVPAVFKTWRNMKYEWQDYLPRGFGNVTIALHEYLGLLFYKIAY